MKLRSSKPPHAERAWVWLLTAGLTLLLSPLGMAQEPASDDLASMSLDKLLELDLVPIDVLGTHTHLAGEWMVGYHLAVERMRGSRDGTRGLTDAQVLEAFPVTPTEMTMEMHMLHVMYAPTDALTLVAKLHYMRLSMDHLTRMGRTFTTRAAGLGDVSVEVLMNVLGDAREGRHRLLLDVGVGLPTGSIEERDDTPAGPSQKLPYPMQLGSGTFDLKLGASYVGRVGSWAWLGEARGTLRLDTNDQGYSLGDRLALTASGSRRLAEWASLSAELEATVWGNIDGADAELNPAVVPTADPQRRAGRRVLVAVGADFYVPSGALEGNRLSLRFNKPVYEWFEGPQLELDWRLEAGWSWAF